MSGTIQKVGDEFVMKIQYYTGDKIDNSLQFDYEYNNKLLELTEFNWDGGYQVIILKQEINGWIQI